MSRKIPALNGLIINSTNCIPSRGFNWYKNKYNKSWGKLVSDCWRKFRVTSTREKQVQDFRQRDGDIEDFLELEE